VELGTVDKDGVSLSKINASKPTLAQYVWSCFRRQPPKPADGALMLDMWVG
jgi:hypothetical protein